MDDPAGENLDAVLDAAKAFTDALQAYPPSMRGMVAFSIVQDALKPLGGSAKMTFRWRDPKKRS